MTDHDLLDQIRTRREYFRALLDLSREQRGLIADRNYSELLTVVARKQRVLGRLDAQKQTHPEIIGAWKSRRDNLPRDLRTICDSLLQETESLLAELLDEEQFCTEQLTRSRDETSRQLQELAGGRHAVRAYGAETPDETHRYLDVNQ